MDTALLVLLVVGGATLLSWPLGRYLHWAIDARTTSGPLGHVDGWLRTVAGHRSLQPQNWRQYATAMLVFHALSFGVCCLLLSTQAWLPCNPDGKGQLSPDLVFHTAASFVANTNLQHYSGEVAMSYHSQLVALMWLQFVSAATGLAVLAALARGIAGRPDMGNFFIDLLRATCFVLLPLALVVACLFVWGGTPMTLQGAATATTLEGAVQTIARGPVAAFVAIKQLGTNGGGFFGANSAHPFENPTFATNALSALCILLLPMASIWMFGHLVGNRRHAAVLFGAMLVLLFAKLVPALSWEAEPTRAFAGLSIAQDVGNLEGKELRFGAASSPVWAVLTTCTSNGSVACMHDSLNPLTGLVALVGMWLGATFGGIGVGMVNLFVYIVLAAFVAGMMVGRTPEYMARRIEVHEVQLAVLTLFAHALFILGGTALFAATPLGARSPNDPGAHGFTEILYEFSSASANNGSGFEGLADNTVAWNVATGVVMLLARFLPMVLPLAIAGSLAGKRPVARSSGSLATDSATFGAMLIATIVFLGALTFLPAAALGPIAEHLQLPK